MHSRHSDFFQSKGYKVGLSSTHKIIEGFNKTEISTILFNFLSYHPSTRLLFQTISKSGEQAVDPDIIYLKFSKYLNDIGTSIIFSIQCKNCKIDIRSYIVVETEPDSMGKKTLQCPKCRRSIYPESIKFDPVKNISKTDLIRFLNAISKKYALFFLDITLTCIYCNDTFTTIDNKHEVDLECPTCHNNRYVFPTYFLDDEIKKLIGNKDGYWLEWYVWRKLKEKDPYHSLLFTKLDDDAIQIEADVGFFQNGKFTIIECKDSNNIDDIFQKIHYINEIADSFILVTTDTVSEKKLTYIKNLINIDFKYISPKMIFDFV